MGDVSSEPTMEEILSSIKRVIEESETAPSSARPRRPTPRPISVAEVPQDPADTDEVLELSERMPFPHAEALPAREAPRTTARAQAAPTPSSVGRADTIVSPDAAEASRGSLEALSRLVVKPDVTGGDTLEGMVREMLRPMLREWLDAQLPGIVEAMVAKEIARISGRGL